MDLAAVFGGQQAEVQDIDDQVAAGQLLLRELRQAPGLGHLARAGAIVAVTAADQQHPRSGGGIRPALLGLLQPLVGVEPLDRGLVVRILEAVAGAPGDRCLAPFLHRLPGDGFQARDGLVLDAVGRIHEPPHEALVELVAGQFRRLLALADLGHRQSRSGDAPSIPSRASAGRQTSTGCQAGVVLRTLPARMAVSDLGRPAPSADMAAKPAP